jgi:uncharacterized iron-regulated membrane protein
MSVTQQRPRQRVRRGWIDRRMVWRWHFYAGLFCAPFVLVLAVSGMAYLFKVELEHWLDRPIDRRVAEHMAERDATGDSGGSLQSAAARAAAALAAFPGAQLQAYELPDAATGDAGQATRVLVSQQGVNHLVYVHPASLEVLSTVPERDRLMRRIARLHGELWLGEYGSLLVELAASWTIVMILTGLFLWWPREPGRWLAGVVYPRVRRATAGGSHRIVWRDLHAVTGVWISAFTLVLLFSGLPWSRAWGGYLKGVRHLTGMASASQSWSTRGDRAAAAPLQQDHTHDGHAMAEHEAATGKQPAPPAADLESLDRILPGITLLGLDPPVRIMPPGAGRRGGKPVNAAESQSTAWSVKSETPNRPRRVDLTVDPATGRILTRQDFADKHVIDRLVGYGIAVHEGRLFGWPNQLLGVLTAAGLVLVVFSGVRMWWRRRPVQSLGAPAPRHEEPASDDRRGLMVIPLVLALAVLLPLFGASLGLVLVTERFLLRRFPSAARWLGVA